MADDRSADMTSAHSPAKKSIFTSRWLASPPVLPSGNLANGKNTLRSFTVLSADVQQLPLAHYDQGDADTANPMPVLPSKERIHANTARVILMCCYRERSKYNNTNTYPLTTVTAG